jgi:hypothetical protein
LFADVAPSRGSQVVFGELTVKAGKKGISVRSSCSTGRCRRSRRLQMDWKATLAFEPAAPMSGAQNTAILKVTDAAKGGAVTDLQPYLGAMGQHGSRAPGRDDVRIRIRTRRFEGVGRTERSRPRAVCEAGWYRCWAQVQRGGKVVTFAFAV